MGNYISCASLSPKLKSPKSARVILPNGEVRQFRESLKAAELMLESPNHFLADSKSLSIGRRFSPLSADEDLEFGNLYVMLPMRKVNSVVTAADVAVFLMNSNSAQKRISGGSVVRISPEMDGDVDSDGGRTRFDFEGVDEYKFRLAASRSKKPLLDTISEEHVCVR